MTRIARHIAQTLLCLVLISGCTSLYDPSVVLCSNKAEFAAYAEAYNSAQSEYIVQIRYEKQPGIDQNDRRRPPDLLISTGLTDPSLLDTFQPLNRLFKETETDPEDFYQNLLLLGTREDKQHVLPLNFNLPVVVYLEGALTEEPPELLIPLDFMRSQSEAFNTAEDEILSRVGFSPLWNEEFLYYTAILFDAGFGATESGAVDWNPSALGSAVEYLRSWITETNGGYEREAAFREKYMKIPYYKLLEERRILFYFTDTESFMRIPPEKRERLGFRWLSGSGQIPVLDNITFAGVPRSAQNKAGAYDFLRWIFESETQTELMEINQYKRLKGVYGIASGFSSLRAVNERHLPQPHFYPFFLGHIPTAEMLRFPLRLPVHWGDMKAEIIEPWLVEAVINPEPPESLATFLATRQESNSPK